MTQDLIPQHVGFLDSYAHCIYAISASTQLSPGFTTVAP